MKKIFFSLQPLPAGISGATFQSQPDADRYLVICNSTTSRQKRRHSFGHEMAHVLLGHFDTAATLDVYAKEGAPQVFYKGEEIHSGEAAPISLNAEPWELEADAAAWSYYHKYKPTFAELEDKGQAYLEV